MKKLLTPLILLAVAIVLPLVFTSNYYVQLFSQTLINIIAVMGLNIVMGLAGLTNLGTIAIVAIGSYAVGILSTVMGSTGLLGLFLALICGLIVGFMLGYPSLRVSGVFLSLTTMSFAQIVYLLANSMTEVTGGAMGIRDIPRPSFFGYQLTSERQLYYLILAVTVLAVVFSIRLIHSKWGRAFIALKDNPEAVESVGLSVTQLKLTAFIIATLMGSLSGVLYAWMIRYLSPTAFITDMSTKYTVILLLGGVGSTAGVIVGSLIVTLLPEALRFMGDYYQLAFYSVALVLLLTQPLGLTHVYGQLRQKAIQAIQKRRKDECNGSSEA
jgi:branched-chain amino acid transport system permease protein